MEGIRADNIVIDVPSIGTLTGNGVIGSNNSLDFKMLMKVSKTSGGMLANISPVSTALQNKGVPFLIQGTTQNPKFLPAIGNQVQGLKQTLLGTVQGNQANGQQGQQKQDLKGLLGGFLGKKKKP